MSGEWLSQVRNGCQAGTSDYTAIRRSRAGERRLHGAKTG